MAGFCRLSSAGDVFVDIARTRSISVAEQIRFRRPDSHQRENHNRRPKDSIAQALAIHDGKIVAIGTNEEIRKIAAKDSRVSDLRAAPPLRV